MKNIYILLILLVGLVSCNNEDRNFDVQVPTENFSFRPVPGGAIMRYKLPENKDIFAVRIRYADAQGESIVKTGTYINDSLVLLGFNEARSGVKAQVCFCNNKDEESAPIEVTFDTEDSAPVAFFERAEVRSYWGGFSLIYDAPETVSGMVHVLYTGINPVNQKPDSILLYSAPIIKGGDTLNFTLEQKQPTYSVVVRTEDYRGYRVKQKVWQDLVALNMEKLDPEEFDFSFEGNTLENDEYKFGTKYLFDGDVKGEQYRANYTSGNRYQYATFITEAHSFNTPFIIDMREKRIPAQIRLYAYLNFGYRPPTVGDYSDAPDFLKTLWNGGYGYVTKLPNHVIVYATDDKDDRSSWVRLAEEKQVTTGGGLISSWAERAYGSKNVVKTDEAFNKAEPISWNISCNYDGTSYRYLIFEVLDTFDYPGETTKWNNTYERVSFNELEVYIKKD